MGDSELLSTVITSLLTEVNKGVEMEEQIKEEACIEECCIINMEDVTKLVNDPNEDGNTMLHLAAFGRHVKLVW